MARWGTPTEPNEGRCKPLARVCIMGDIAVPGSRVLKSGRPTCGVVLKYTSTTLLYYL